MGICYQDAKILWEARLGGVPFNNTLTVGHQMLALHPSEVKLMRRAYHDKFPDSESKVLEKYKFREYSDRFLYDFLGVNSLSIIDFSPYEGANIIHDLNKPISDDLGQRFDAVIDVGSLEHIFNFQVAIANLMKMLKIGGHIFISTPCNNLCGHGFYQFSPELFFRVFSSENGFKLRRLILLEAVYPIVELTSNRKTYSVVDPANVGRRVGLISNKPIIMMVEATKIAVTPLFSRAPLQSDYVSLWEKDGTRSLHSGIRNVVAKVYRHMPFFFQRRVEWYRQKKYFSLSNSKLFTKL